MHRHFPYNATTPNKKKEFYPRRKKNMCELMEEFVICLVCHQIQYSINVRK